MKKILGFMLRLIHRRLIQKSEFEALKYDIDMDLEWLRETYRVLGLEQYNNTQEGEYYKEWDLLFLKGPISKMEKSTLPQWRLKKDIPKIKDFLKETEYKEVCRLKKKLDDISDRYLKILNLKLNKDECNFEAGKIFEQLVNDIKYVIKEGNPIR